MRWMTLLGGVLFACGTFLAGCGKDNGGSGEGTMTKGEQIFRTPREEGNSFSCSTCHALSAQAEDGFRKPGHPLADATARPHYKNGSVDELRTAVNSCLEEWMTAPTWEASNADWKALRNWLADQAPDGEAEPVTYQIAEPPDDFSGGDPETGKELFNESCAGCHGTNGRGSSKAIPLAGKSFRPSYVANRVRTSGLEESAVYDGLTGGRMPFWSKDRLSDDELIDITAYLARGETFEDAGMGDAGMDAGMPDADTGVTDTGSSSQDTSMSLPDVGNCSKTHRKVGWTATLEEKNHNVGGTATIVDDCTILIENFTYDGRGINVKLYGAKSHGNYTSGYPISGDLVRDEPYQGERLVVTLPEGKTLDALGGVSVWCIDVGVDFGSGKFTAP